MNVTAVGQKGEELPEVGGGKLLVSQSGGEGEG